MPKITQLQSDEFDLRSLAPDSGLLTMMLCNLFEPEVESLLSTFPFSRIIYKPFFLSKGIKSVGGASAWGKYESYLSSHVKGQKLETGNQGRQAWDRTFRQ